jgi:antirestriction protein ArdC
MMLEFQSAFGGYSLPLWCGAAQAKAKNWFPKKGSHGSYILRPQMNAYEEKDEGGKTVLNDAGEASIKSWVSYKTACVFNAEALRGVDEEAEAALQAEIAKQIGNIVPKTDNERIEKAHDVLNHWAKIVPVTFAGDKAFYVPSLDKITIPPIEYFENSEAFYATWCHEAIHSTGHPDRLKREMGTSMESDKYAREELVAEMGAFILADRLEIGSDVQNHAAYLEGWLKVLKEGPKALFKAVGDANKGANMIYSDQTQTDEDSYNG